MNGRRIMKRVLSLSVVDLLKIVTLRNVLLAALMGGLVYGVMLIQSPARAIWRDAVVAIIAHHRAGDKVPLDLGPNLAKMYEPGYTWGVNVNSEWLMTNTMYVVPFFAYEGVAGQPMYPEDVYFLPVAGTRSMTVGGQAFPKNWAWGGGGLLINERYLTDPRWIDERRTLSTLVHELTHLQGGRYLSGTSEQFESATVATTTEMLAAMCMYQNDVACGAFWDDVEGHALVGLATRMPEWLYDLFADVFIRDAAESIADRKTDRFWADDEMGRRELREKYGRKPWEEWIIPGVVYGYRMDTFIRAPGSFASMGYMAFDDTSDLLGWPLRLVLQLGSTPQAASRLVGVINR